MLIPLGFFVFLIIPVSKMEVLKQLEREAALALDVDTAAMEQLVSQYRHKAYAISTDPNLIKLLQLPKEKRDPSLVKTIYTDVFSIMKGDTYKASAHIVSSDGEVQLSTHLFPKRYDPRLSTGESDMTNPITWNVPGPSTELSIQNRYTNEIGDQVCMSFTRNVFDADDNNLGYVIVDIYAELLDALRSKKPIFDEELLVNPEQFFAASVLDLSKYGDYTNFPSLAERPKGKMQEGIFRTKNYVLSFRRLTGTQLFLVGAIRIGQYSRNMEVIVSMLLASLVIGFCLSLVLAYYFAKRLTEPIHEVIKSMHYVEEGNLTIRIKENQIEEINQLNDSFNNMVIKLVQLLQRIQEDDKRTLEAERKNLAAQLNPHFLFNTLNTIKALAKINGQDEIYEISIKLGNLLRDNLYDTNADSTVEASMDLVRDYLAIQKIRFGTKLKVYEDIEEKVLELRIPKLIIQPLVENALKHGLEPKTGEWELRISCREVHEGKMLEICVADNGIGIDRNLYAEDFAKFKGSSHVGLYNIYRRLILNYGTDMDFSVTKGREGGTVSTILLPLRSTFREVLS
ncbi:MAG: sensor histidine kinase [Spirochaetia bacterium]|jgi:two-component system sensor histidine kinase YesM|nr:sensor histidine kinase [Spirochaetia bacterium]